MLITTPHYAGFSASNHIEELLFQLAQKIGDVQKDSGVNTQDSEVITVDCLIHEEIADITCLGWMGRWIDGELIVKDLFPDLDFTAGVGNYPFNRTNLLDAFFHVAVFAQKMEITTAKNPSKKSYVTWDLTPVTTMGSGFQVDVKLNISNYPINVTIQSDQTIIKAKPYLVQS